MYRFTTGLVIAGLVLMFGVTRSSGEPLNPTVSDVNLNTAGGTGALETVTEPANSNTAFGFNALFSNTSGSFNTANGTSALYLNTAGIRNTATGTDALYSNTSGNFNVAMGALALFSNTSGSFNTVNGTSALYLNTTGSRNTATGVHALASNATGASNTAIGYLALVYSTGNKNIALGNGAGAALASGNRNIYLGHPGATSESKTMRLGSEQTKTYIAGVTTAAVTGLIITWSSTPVASLECRSPRPATSETSRRWGRVVRGC